MRTRILGTSLLAFIAAVSLPLEARGPGVEHFSTRLLPIHEVPTLSSVARGAFSAEIDDEAGTLSYTLSYEDLEGPVLQAHIHLGQRDVNGGISIWLCSNLPFQPTGPTPLGTQACPAPPATITGTVTAAEVVGPAAQGIAAGEFAEIVSAIRSDRAYANVHSQKFPGGEIRGQLRRGRGHAHR